MGAKRGKRSSVGSGQPGYRAAVTLFRATALASALVIGFALLAGVQTPPVWPLWLTLRQVFLQDIWLVSAMFGTVGLAMIGSTLQIGRIELSRLAVATAAVAVTAFCYSGHYVVLDALDLTRDEQMVTFDAWILRHGALVWPLPEAWQPDAEALNLLFHLPVHQPVAWASAYLPGNALLHAVIGSLADHALTAPLLAGLSVPLLWSICRAIWPGEREVATIILLLFVTSGQVILTGMTTFSMTAHLFFNLAWLRLFLTDRPAADGAALVFGLFATGLHQLLFHPLFVAPFLVILLTERRWFRFAFFLIGYAAIALFWSFWPEYLHDLVRGPHSYRISGGTDYWTRLRDAMAQNVSHIPLLGANLLRFCTWQNALLLPLLFAAWPTIRRERLPAALALGLILPLVVLSVILPWQGNGFGYRYVHPVLGNALLLAGYGWRNLAALHDRLRPAFAIATVVTMLVLLPMWLVMTHLRYAPFVRAEAVIAASGADYLVLDREQGLAYGSLVINRPDLSNRPLRLAADAIRDPTVLAKRICTRGVTVAMATNSFFRPGAAYFQVQPLDTANALLPALRAPYEAAGCRIVLLR